ncbi:hypothetical protein VNO78_32760 [Psophocarpus tetragonolobus]|uniref:Uncharacterized protein n=1 Tax=Psophocarpus tetragonolobus TaxID=3891 RepID=A0AAN9RPN4_PSOTE
MVSFFIRHLHIVSNKLNQNTFYAVLRGIYTWSFFPTHLTGLPNSLEQRSKCRQGAKDFPKWSKLIYHNGSLKVSYLRKVVQPQASSDDTDDYFLGFEQVKVVVLDEEEQEQVMKAKVEN